MSTEKLEFINEQLSWVDQWTNNLISDIKEEDCLILDHLGTSINWQIGHIIVSKYFHTVQCILPHNHSIAKECRNRIPWQEMVSNYFVGSNPCAVWPARPSKTTLMKYKEWIDKATMDTLTCLSPADLMLGTETKNPVAKNKYEALAFSFKHQMWHNGQIAMMKRIIESQN